MVKLWRDFVISWAPQETDLEMETVWFILHSLGYMYRNNISEEEESEKSKIGRRSS